MRVLITGNLGYVGAPLIRHLAAAPARHTLIGYDSGFFLGNLTSASQAPETLLDAQFFGDIRAIGPELFEGVDAVVQLAAVSNDPMGVRFEAVTDAINNRSAIEVAKLASRAGVKNFVFASSCSVYGAAGNEPRREEAELNPLTAYARSKVAAEQDLEKVDGSMTITCLRFATACGMSDRLRLDLVLNDFMLNALLDKTVRVLSDGTPFRPLIDVSDMARAIEWAIARPSSQGGRFVVVNTGDDRWNFQVKDLAEAVAGSVPGTSVSINKNAAPDKRSYSVNFEKYKQLATSVGPAITLDDSIARLAAGIDRMLVLFGRHGLDRFRRLPELQRLIAEKQLKEDLSWQGASAAHSAR